MAADTTAVTAVKSSFFSKVKAELKKLFAHAPGWEASAAATLTYLAPLVEGIVALADPAAAPVVTGIIGRVQSAMAAAVVVLEDAGPTPTLMTYLNAISSGIAEVESAFGLKDGAATAKVAALVTTITGEVNAILKELEPTKA